jgi:hypothetical protein
MKVASSPQWAFDLPPPRVGRFGGCMRVASGSCSAAGSPARSSDLEDGEGHWPECWQSDTQTVNWLTAAGPGPAAGWRQIGQPTIFGPIRGDGRDDRHVPNGSGRTDRARLDRTPALSDPPTRRGRANRLHHWIHRYRAPAEAGLGATSSAHTAGCLDPHARRLGFERSISSSTRCLDPDARRLGANGSGGPHTTTGCVNPDAR